MVFALIAMEDLYGVSGTVHVAVVTIGLTVLASVVLHGLTAQPLVVRYVAGRAAEPSAPSADTATVCPGPSSGQTHPHPTAGRSARGMGDLHPIGVSRPDRQPPVRS